MKTSIKFLTYSALSLALALISCQKEEYALPDPPNRGGTISDNRIAPTAMLVGSTKGIAAKAKQV